MHADQETFALQLLCLLVSERMELQKRLDALRQHREEHLDYLRAEAQGERNLRTLTGDSPAMRKVRQAIGQVAPTDSTVLITGETGTGKELVARGIHQLSRRRAGLLVNVNCAALSPTLLPSELFGHEAGAFTGASKRRVGRFELAHGGTLFLDEIAELPLEMQVVLLRVLQERSIERVGGNQVIAVDVRVIAATHQDLATLVQEGRFRADLYYRLNVFPIHVPALRERIEDIPQLARHFLHHFARRMGKHVSGLGPEVVEFMQRYAWPGNVRELENIIERAMIAADGETLYIDPRWLTVPVAPQASPASLRTAEQRAIEAALHRSGGKIYGRGGAAELLHVKPTTLYAKMRKLGIKRHAAARDD